MLYDGPLAGETTAEQLAPSKSGLFVAKPGEGLIVVVVSESGRAAEDFELQGSKKCVLQDRAGVLFLVECLDLVEQITHHGQTPRALVQMGLGFLEVERFA